ncbi:hypothetical protein DV736_g4587, partial [Chaetothyriales sp. CBS 134916]
MTRIATDHEAVSFHVYQPGFNKLLGPNPSAHLLIESTEKIPLYHEACIYHPATRSIFVTSNQIPSDRDCSHTSSKQVKLSRIYDNGSASPGHVEFVHFEGIEGAMLNGGVNFGEDALLLCAQGSQRHDDFSGLIALSIPNSSNPVPEARTIISSFYGVPFNSVNDVVVDPRDSSIWFTDPEYGFHQGIRHPPQLPNQVYRFDPTSKSIRAVAVGFTRPNGLCFSPDFDKLYVTDTGAIHGSASIPYDPTGPSHIYCFDIGNMLSLDSSSVSIPVRNQSRFDRVDLPMRAFTGGYYNNLRAMYEYLGAEYQAQPFLYSFSKKVAIASQEDYNAGSILPKLKWLSYFVHSSNLKRIPPDRPEADGESNRACETLDEYLHRIRLPQYFVTHYVLPVLSSIATCSHRELLNFPAADVTEYKRKMRGQRHYRVSNGVQEVQDKLGRGIDKRLSARVSAVEPLSSGVRIRWTQREDAHGQTVEKEELFDRVILAVSPDVVAKVFSPLQQEMTQIPTVSVESIVHADRESAGEGAGQLFISGQKNIAESNTRLLHDNAVQTIYFRTSVVEGNHRTEAVHIQPSGALVTTCPFSYIDPAQVIKSSRFTRVLRTPESRRITNDIFGNGNPLGDIDGEKRSFGWKNGDGSVWLVGGWCWDVASTSKFVFADVMLTNIPKLKMTSEFPIACRTLLDEVLITAKLLPQHGRSKDFKRPHTLTIIDLGFGCGDQTVYLMNEISKNMSLVDSFTGVRCLRLIDRYVGVTESGAQFKFAENRLTTLGLLGSKTDGPSIEIFCADAAQPTSWTDNLARATKEKAASPRPFYIPPVRVRAGLQPETARDSSHRQTWILALDTLYHFSPSRQPILNHAYRELEASLMAFDLILTDHASIFDRALLAAVRISQDAGFGWVC